MNELPGKAARTRGWMWLVVGVALAVPAVYAGDTAQAGLEDRVLTATRAAPVAPVAPLSMDALTRADNAAGAAGADQSLPVITTTAADTPPATTHAAQPVAAHTVAAQAADATLQDTPVVPVAGEANSFVYRSRAGDWLDTSPRFSERGIARKFDAEVGMSAGSGGALRTYGAVTVPLIDNVLSVRISGATGSGYGLRGNSRDGSRDGLLRSGTMYDGPMQFNRFGRDFGSDFGSDFGGGTDLGLDVHWAPSDSFRLDVHTQQSTNQQRGRGRR